MLSKVELTELTKVTGFNVWQTEKDYLQHILLLFLSQRIKRGLVFKGGTALQKIFGLNRFSIGLDFTLTINEIRESIEKVSRDITNFGFPCELFKVEEKRHSKNITLKVKGPLYDGTEKTISNLRMKISLRKDLLLEPKVIEVIPVYPDLRPYFLPVMHLEEILAEKIRAMVRRSRARDMYDLWFLLRKGVKAKKSIVEKKLGYYNLKFDEKRFLMCLEDVKIKWGIELKPLVTNLPSFKKVKGEIEKLIETSLL